MDSPPPVPASTPAADSSAQTEPQTRGQPEPAIAPAEVEKTAVEPVDDSPSSEVATPAVESPTTSRQPPTNDDPAEPEAEAEEARMTGTFGKVVLPFSIPVQGRNPEPSHGSKTPETGPFAHVGKTEKDGDFAHVGKIEQPLSFSTLWGAGTNPVWRPRKFVRDDSYPSVTAAGFYFRKDSGGFALIRRTDRKCVGFYTKLSIQELEQQHGNKNSKSKRRPGRTRTGRGRDG
jgi:hypothetical protein